MAVTQEALDAVALSRAEYELLVERLGREPGEVELGMFGSLWSEHCGYKNSKPLLRLLPGTGERVLTRAGAENAGAIDIGDGLCVVMKVESHNHPSAIEPYQGAATGVGGILRDIFAMGAYPIALLDSLRFGPPDEANNRYLMEGVVAGIGGYGNCIGVPTVGGEIGFSTSYTGNPLVNAMCVGIARSDRLASAVASGAGNAILLVGADTGRDGIHGASGLASRTDPGQGMRPAVQVGNPFMEKLLLEACYELANEHPEWIVGIQDCGAAGLTSAIVECCAKGESGAIVDVSRVPRRESGMTPYEVMLSESQERMVIIARRERVENVRALFEHWELHCEEIGTVVDGTDVVIADGETEVGRVPVNIATDPPLYRREGSRPAAIAEANRFDPETLPDLAPGDASAVLLRLLARPNIASKRAVFRQYDHQVQNNTVVLPGGDAAVLRVPGTARGLAVSTDCNSRLCHLDPWTGGALAVAEAARNVACTGATPIAVTDCLNFGNPEKPDVYWTLEQAVSGIAAAARRFGTPVVSGNVSLYNETQGGAVFPTPVIGMLGLIEDASTAIGAAFREPGAEVWLLGGALEQPATALAGSEYLEAMHDRVAGMPQVDLEHEARLQALLVEAVAAGLLDSAHDCSEGGLAVALGECCLFGGLGFEGAAGPSGRLDAALFGEGQGRVVISLRADRVARLGELAGGAAIEATRLGMVTAEAAFRFGPVTSNLEALGEAYESTFPLR